MDEKVIQALVEERLTSVNGLLDRLEGELLRRQEHEQKQEDRIVELLEDNKRLQAEVARLEDENKRLKEEFGIPSGLRKIVIHDEWA